MDISYILNILGEDREQYSNAVAPPIFQTSNFAFKTVADFRLATKNELISHLYTRGNNPTTEIVRKKIAALEGILKEKTTITVINNFLLMRRFVL